MGTAEKRSTKHLPASRPAIEHPAAYLDALPLPMALWDASRHSCMLNLAALQLLKFSQEDFQTQPNLWVQQVYGNDLLAWHAQLRRFGSGDQPVTCDYRFFPKGAEEPIWLREVMMPIKTSHALWTSMSAYSDISDLKKTTDEKKLAAGDLPATHDETLRGLFHDVNNRLQRLSMEIELAGLESQLHLEAGQKFTDALVGVTQAIALIHDRVLGPKSHG